MSQNDLPSSATLAGKRHFFSECDACNGRGSRIITVIGPDKELPNAPHDVVLTCRECGGKGFARHRTNFALRLAEERR
jgi:hypothetical protein